MANEWNEELLVDCLETIIDYRGKTPKKSDDGILTLSAKSVKMGKIDYGQAYFISEKTYAKFMVRGFPKVGDVLMTTEAPLGCVVRLDRDDVGLAQRLITLRGKSDILDNGYLLYFLMSARGQHELLSRASGTTVQGIKRTEFAKVKIPVPPLPEQKRIAQILTTLDDKIELSRQMNQTLEQMAQALFKSWFVNFDPVIDNALAAGNPIPDELQERAERRQNASTKKELPANIKKLFPAEFEFSKELDKWVPLGWNVKSILEFVDLIGGGTPKTSINDYWDGDIPWFSVVDAPAKSDVFVLDTEKHVTQTGVDNSSTKILPVGTTIISARGTVGKCALVGVPMAMNQSCYGVRGKDGITDSFTYYTIRENVSDLQLRGHGSVFNTITRETFKTIKQVYGNEAINSAFDIEIQQIFEKIKLNLLQIQSLTNLRDTLLPKLISGKIRVPENNLETQ